MALEIRGLAPLIQVYDMPTSVRFYTGPLGFELITHAPFYAEGLFHWCLLRRDGVELMLNTAYDEGERPAAPDKVRNFGHGDVTLYFGCPDVDAAYRHLAEQGIKLNPPSVAHYGMKQLSLTDPDGYGICFQWPAQSHEKA